MLCKIADLFAEIPEEGGLIPLLEEYKASETIETPDICLDKRYYRYEMYPEMDADLIAYIESGIQFYSRMVYHGGILLHSSAVELDGKAYLFSGPSGVGKSTHTGFWKELFPNSRIFNDDKPALRQIEGVWYAYGTPWSGKNKININMKAPLAGICFLKQGDELSIRRLSTIEAVSHLIHQTMHRFYTESKLDMMLKCVESLATQIPIYELTSTPVVDAAKMSYEAMKKGAEEKGL